MSERYIIASTFEEAKKYAESQRLRDWKYIDNAASLLNLQNDEVHILDSARKLPTFDKIKSVIIQKANEATMEAISSLLPSVTVADSSVQQPVKKGNVVVSDGNVTPISAPAQQSSKPSPQNVIKEKASKVVQTNTFKIVKGD